MTEDLVVEDLRNRPVLVVICGAGASFDSISSLPLSDHASNPDRPPLTQHLFDDHRIRTFLQPYPAAQSLIAALAVDPSRSDFESLLNLEYEASEGNANLLRRFTALRLYLRDMLATHAERWSSIVGGATNYSWLVGEVDHWRLRNNGYVAWLTFNYDPLLEDALAAHYSYDFGIGGQADPGLHTYIGHPDWSLIHLHGSTRWTRLTSIPRAGLGQQDVANALVEAWDPRSDAPSGTTIYQRALGMNAVLGASNSVLLGKDHALIGVPAIAAPLASKSSFECPPNHVHHLRSVLAQSDFVLTIGWRVQDPQFVKILAETIGNSPDIAAVSRSRVSAESVCTSIGTALNVSAPSPIRITAFDVEGFSGLRVLAGPRFRSQISSLVHDSGVRRQASWVSSS